MQARRIAALEAELIYIEDGIAQARAAGRSPCLRRLTSTAGLPTGSAGSVRPWAGSARPRTSPHIAAYSRVVGLRCCRGGVTEKKRFSACDGWPDLAATRLCQPDTT